MAFDKTGIINMALGKIPTARITSPNENSLQASVAGTYYSLAVLTMLEMADWGFGRLRATLTQNFTNDRKDWAFSYALPADLAMPIRLLRPIDPLGSFVPQVGQIIPVYNDYLEEAGLPYDYAGTNLYSNQESAVLEYVGSLTGEPMFTALFVDGLTSHLAAYCAPGITKSDAKTTKLQAEAEVKINRAIAANANRRPQEYGNFIPDTVTAQQGGYPGWYNGSGSQ